MVTEHLRIRREKKTIEAMVRIYCKNHHESQGELCPECNELFEYAKMRLDKCPFQEKKTTCGKCLIARAIDGRKKPEKIPKNSLTHYSGVHLEIFPQNIKNKYCE